MVSCFLLKSILIQINLNRRCNK